MTESTPPSTAAAPGGEPPPLTAFAWRHGLIRPTQGRILAGVSGALARATNTDPVLWRVVLVVLTLFGGIGLLIYVLAWLLLPADGDTATPVEALSGRGHSRTSTPRTIFGIVIGIFMLAGYVSEPFRATPLLAIVLLGGVLLLLLRDQSRAGRGPAPAPYAAPTAAAPHPAATAAAPYPAAGGAFASASGPYTAPTATPGAGTAPFAPQGPFAPPPPVFPPPAPPPLPPRPPVARWQPPPTPPRPRSRLGQLTLSLAVLVLGGLVAADLVGFTIAPLAYLAVPLAVLGLGLLVGTWVGRARWLIPLGLVLTLALGGGYAALGDDDWHRAGVGVVTLRPQSVDEVPDSYHRNLGAIELDLSDVDFTGTTTTMDLRIGLGAIDITLPPDVDVTVDGSVNVGSAVVLGQSWDGVGAGSREVSDTGADGVGGGVLHIRAAVNTGSIEIHRVR